MVINTAHTNQWLLTALPGNIAHSRDLGRAENIIKATSHPDHHLFTLQSSGRRSTLKSKDHTSKGQFFLDGYQNIKLRHAVKIEISVCIINTSVTLFYCTSLMLDKFWSLSLFLFMHNPFLFIVMAKKVLLFT